MAQTDPPANQVPPGRAALRRNAAWLLLALAAGAVPSALIQRLIGGPSLHYILVASGMGAIFSAVIWGGHRLTIDWLETHPASFSPVQAALWTSFKWALVYIPLFFLGALLIRLILGINCLQYPLSAFFAFFIGLIISTQITNILLNSKMIATVRSLERTRAQASFLALKAQLSPHTLFNALNMIASLIPEDPRAAERAVLNLSGLLRRILGGLERESWTLAEEFQVLRDLLELQQARFGPRLSYELVLPGPEEALRIPPLLLLPLVENSFKHGFRSKVGPCRLSVQAEGGTIRVQDDGAGLKAPRTEGLGTRMVRQRVEAVGGSLAWPQVDEGCIAEVRLCP
jgi:two-component sensor histidine kinase